MPTATRPDRSAPQWGRFDQAFTSNYRYENPVQDAQLRVTFTTPSGRTHTVDGFWDGGVTWRVRLMPDEPGVWRFTTACSDTPNTGLHDLAGAFYCSQPEQDTAFTTHGPLRLADSRRHLAHADGTPFFWLGDTCWAGPLQATDAEFDDYLRVRAAQRFNAVQFMGIPSIASPMGDRDGSQAFMADRVSGKVAVNAAFFQRMDARLDALNRAGMLAVPALLWAAEWTTAAVNQTNPGLWLAEEQCVLLARYMVARWGAHHVAWILPGDADYSGPKAPRWQRIGRAVFGDGPHAPVTLHTGGWMWYGEDFRHEDWLDLITYQSGHANGEADLRWHVEGPPATDWHAEPVRPIINLEPCYEYHVDQRDLPRRLTPFDVRRAVYWSLLVSPPAGVTYGGHGVWGWDDGVRPPVHHPRTGVALPWRQALQMPAAYQMAHVAGLFESLAWWSLLPAPDLVADQPGRADVSRTIVAARTATGDVAVLYVPDAAAVRLTPDLLQPNLPATWFDPRTGTRQPATPQANHTYLTPTPGEDWVLVCGA